MDPVPLVARQRTSATLDVKLNLQSWTKSLVSRRKPTHSQVEKPSRLSIPTAIDSVSANSIPLPPFSPNSMICFVDPEQKPGLLVTDELDVAIEECRRKVELISKDCRSKNRKFRDVEFDLENDAERCLHGISYPGTGGGWDDIPAGMHKDVLRVTQIFENPHYFSAEGAANSNDIVQGFLGNCWFLSALAIASTARGLIEKVCVGRDEEVGVYGFVFFRNDRWVDVIIDDQLFTRIPKYEELRKEDQELYHDDKSNYERLARKGGKTLTFARSGKNGETWVPLFEKAYAKLHGNYNHLQGGFESEALEVITGGVATFLLTKDILDPDRFWAEELCRANKDRLFGGSISMSTQTEVQGLVANHAYSVLRAVECKGKRFVVVRNPWGRKEWTGPWSDGSKEWQGEWLDILPELGHVFGDDGQFVMEYKDFLNTYTNIDRTILFDSTWVMTSYWLNVPVAPPASAWTYGDVSFLLYLPEPSATVIVLSQLNMRYCKSLKSDARWSLDFTLVKLGEEKPMAQSNHDWAYSRNVNLEVNLDKGNYVIYVRIACLNYILTDKEDPLVACNCKDAGCACPAYLPSHSLATMLSDKVQGQSIAKNFDASNFADYVPADLDSLIQKDLKDYHAHVEKQSSTQARAKASVKKSVSRFFRKKDSGPESQVMPPIPKKKREEQKKREEGKKEEDRKKGEKKQDESKSTSEKSNDEDKFKRANQLKTLVKDKDELVVGLRVYTHKDCAAVVVGRLKSDLQ